MDESSFALGELFTENGTDDVVVEREIPTYNTGCYREG